MFGTDWNYLFDRVNNCLVTSRHKFKKKNYSVLEKTKCRDNLGTLILMLSCPLEHYLEADVSRNERKMVGFASWEIFGTGFEILIFLWFSCDVQVSKFWIFPRFPAIFRGTKKILKTRIFPQCLGILKDGLVQKFFAVFPAMNRAQNLDFLVVSRIFLLTQKILETWFSPRFLGISKDRLVQIFSELELPRSFLEILKCRTHLKNSEPANLSAVFFGF